MTRVVLDASVISEWLQTVKDPNWHRAENLRIQMTTADLAVSAPTILRLELVNVAGRRWKWSVDALLDLVQTIEDSEIRFIDPDLIDVARWTARGLSAYDSSYVALAENLAVPLITEDRLILATAPQIARALDSI